MELFSEIYGLYYRIVGELLNRAPLTREEVQQAALDSGFAESVLHLVPKLLDERAWPLLQERDGLLYSRLRHPVRTPVSLLELRWLKSALGDPRARLFLADREIAKLHELLFDLPPLFDPEDFIPFDRFRDGDDYFSFDYIRHFRRVLAALRDQKPVKITYQTGAHSGGVKVHAGDFLPLKLEYSEKNDKFRVHSAMIRYGKLSRYATINLGRILETQDSREQYRGRACDLAGWFLRNRSPEPVTAEIIPERNAVERFLLEFSAYEKQSEFDGETGICRVRLWYPMPDETELLVRILGFGPTVRVTGPERFVRQIRERVRKQRRLIAKGAGREAASDPAGR
ncbi:MAG TPA: WYL domain-containing protein [Candidatus Fimivivens faecavium]|nr:WYL domain-containing protein [Candidatus Fimivivens faecavium]